MRQSDIFTDGSCIPHTTLLGSLLNERTTHTSGAIILKAPNDTEGIGTAIHATDGHLAGIHTAYGMELTMATVASTIRHILHETPGPTLHIYSDSRLTV